MVQSPKETPQKLNGYRKSRSTFDLRNLPPIRSHERGELHSKVKLLNKGDIVYA
jgi:hypothetical protein